MNQETKSVETYSYEQSQALFSRAKKVIPNGIYGHFNPGPQKPHGTYPFYVSKADGAR